MGTMKNQSRWVPESPRWPCWLCCVAWVFVSLEGWAQLQLEPPVNRIRVVQDAPDAQKAPVTEATSDLITLIVELKEPPLALRGDNAAQQRLLRQQERFVDDLQQLISSLNPDFGDPVSATSTYKHVLNALVVTLPEEIAAEVSGLQDVKRATADFPVHAQATPVLQQIRADSVHRLHQVTGRNVVVAVVDSGIDYRHRDLGGGLGINFKVLGGYDFVNKDTDPLDDYGHGTHVAGIIAAQGTITGVAPDARLFAYKVLDSDGRGSASTVIAAIERAVDPDQNPATDDGADVINLSLGGFGHPLDPLSRACTNAVAMGAVCVAAAGNDGNFEMPYSPAGADAVITTGSVDRGDRLAGYSTKGPSALLAVKPDLVAPGESIVSTAVGGGSRVMSGTSMSCGMVSGVAALILERRPEASPNEVKSLLTTSAVGGANTVLEQGSGRVDALAAIESETLIQPSMVSLGRVERSGPTWTGEARLTVINRGLRAIEYRATIDPTQLAEGVSATVTEPMTVAPGDSGAFTFSLSVDTIVCKPWRDLPLLHAGILEVEGGGSKWRIPFSAADEMSDRFEPNNDYQQATELVLTDKRRLFRSGGRTKIEPGSTAADEDWFRFEARLGQVLFAYADAPLIGSTLSPEMRLLDANLRPVASGGGPTKDDQRIVNYSIPRNGTYYLQIKARDGVSTGPYRLFAHWLPEPAGYWIPGWSNPVEFTKFLESGRLFQQSQVHTVLAQFPMPPATPLMRHQYLLQGSRGLLVAELTVAIGANSGVSIQQHRFADFQDGASPFLSTSRNGNLSVTATAFLGTNDLWLMDANGNWTENSTVLRPKPRELAALVYDLDRAVVWMIGGYADGEYLNDIWSWNGSVWRDHSPTAGSSPEPRYSPSLAYDTDRKRVVMYGGYRGGVRGGYAFDMWEWDGSQWSAVASPPAVINSEMTYDSRRKCVVLVDGNRYRLWEYKASSSQWKEQTTAPPPQPAVSGVGYRVGMVFDPQLGETVLLTESMANRPPETWTWNGIVWKRWGYTFPADAKIDQGFIWFDPNVNRLRLHSERSVGAGQQLWTLEANGWTASAITNAPTTRFGSGFAFDTKRGQLLRYGGKGPGSSRLQIRHSPDPNVVHEEFFPDGERLTGLHTSPDGNSIVLVQAGRLQVRDRNGMLLRSHMLPAPAEVRQSTQDGRVVILLERASNTMSQDVVYDTVSGRERYRLAGGDRLSINGDADLLIEQHGKTIYGSRWDSSQNTYKQAWRFVSDPDEWFGMTRVSANGSLVAVLGGRPGSGSGQGGVSVHLVNGENGRLLARYHRDDHPRIQRFDGIAEAAINDDGSLAAIATWGRDRQHPECLVLSPFSGSPVWELATRGSARSIDLAGSKFIAGTKGSHASIGEGRGEVFAADLTELVANPPPNLSEATAHPWSAAAGSDVTLTASVTDASGLARVTAIINSPHESQVDEVTLFDDGEHGDGQANDGVWGGFWQTELRPAQYSVSFMAEDRCGAVGCFEHVTQFTTCPTPWITVVSAETAQPAWQAGRNLFSLKLNNRGTMDSGPFRIQVACNDPRVAWQTDNEINAADIQGLKKGETLDLNSTFAIHLPDTLLTSEPIRVTVLVTEQGQSRRLETLTLVPR